MEQSIQPAAGRMGRQIAAAVHFIRFNLPVLVGGIAFCVGCSVQINLPMLLLIGLLFAFPLVFFFLLPFLLKITKLANLFAKLPIWLILIFEWILLFSYAFLLGMGFQFNHYNAGGKTIWSMMWTAFLILSVTFLVLYFTRNAWIDKLPRLQGWEGGIRLFNFVLLLLLLVWGLLPGQQVPTFLLIALLVSMGMCLALTLLSLCWDRRSGESYFREVSGFIFLAFGFVMLFFSIQ